ncbi:hypothetical protein [Mariniblastus fucicola]|uniref:hypothetical protein n=1 Tax=Mariniblastus fucicola TaxID=980251 RepID=UPI0011E01CA7|nr:hypothetical protein [Mariniblastus fucicola]
MLLTSLLLMLIPATAFAGGGPENVLVVVNDESDSSRLIANHYISLRGIPDRNVVYLKDIPFKEATTFAIFESKILRPVLRAIEDRKLVGSIDYIVYSADFPTTIRIPELLDVFIARAKVRGQKVQKKLYNPQASISSLTYLAGQCLHNKADVLDLRVNQYYRIPTALMLKGPFIGTAQKEFERAVAAFAKEPSDPLFESAITSLSAMAKNNPGQTAVLYWLSKFAAKQGDETAATRWMTRAIAMGWSNQTGTLADPDFSQVNDTVFRGIVNRMTNDGRTEIASRGFRQLYQWAPNGMLNQTAGQGERYFLSTVLAVTRNDGNSEAEAVRQIQRSVAADFTNPKGTFFFASTKDVRTRTRKAKFQQAINELQAMGHQAEIIKTKMPKNRPSVLGFTAGTPSFDWSECGSSIVPGAICENLTSFGGRLGNVGNQTALNEFLRYGAAGSSGTVTEPYTITQKFPSPMIHVHYARGCSLAEAFYQSLYGPFQTLIVGDALCQPFAKPPVVEVDGIAPMETISHVKRLSFNKENSPVRVAGMELYIDGRLRKRDPSLKPLEFDTRPLTDGYHEIRIVFVAANQIQTNSRSIIPIIVNNNDQSCTLTTGRPACGVDDSITLTFAATGATSIRICQHEKVIATVENSGGVVDIEAKELGRGPTTLRAIATINGKEVSSKPLHIKVNGPLLETRPRTSKKRAKKQPSA